MEPTHLVLLDYVILEIDEHNESVKDLFYLPFPSDMVRNGYIV